MISFDINYNTTGASLNWKQHVIATYNDGSVTDEVSDVSRDLSFEVNTRPQPIYHYEQINFEDKSELVEIIQARMPIISRAYDADGNVIAEYQGSVIPESWVDSNTNVVSVDIGNGVTTINDAAFWGCANLTAITIPETVIEIGNTVFSFCESLRTVQLPSGITKISDAMFSNCSSLEEVNIPNGVTTIGNSAFMSCTGLTAITIPETVNTVENNAFLQCTNLTDIVIQNNVTSIGISAFQSCFALTSVTFGNNVTRLDDQAFCWANHLNNITCLSETEITDFGTFVFYGLPEVGTLYTPNSSSDWTTFLSYLPSGWKQVKKIVATSKAYDKNGNVVYEVEGDIPNRWLYSKTNVYRIEIADGVKSIGEEAFNNCSNITELIIPDSVTDIGNGYVANMCSNLTNLVIGNGVTSIGEAAFTNCQNLTSVTIGSNVTYIGSRAFNMCNKLDIVICLGKDEITNFGDVSPFKDIWRNGDVYTPNATDWWWTFLGKFEINWTQHFSLPN